MDLCTTTALKEKFYLNTIQSHQNQFLSSASWTKPSTCLASFTKLRLALLAMLEKVNTVILTC